MAADVTSPSEGGPPDGRVPDAPEQTPKPEQVPKTPGFGERGRMRRRARFLRRARELAYRDLGGLVFDLHRFGQRNDQIVMAKLGTLGQIDSELRALEAALRERQPVTVLREVGIGACPRCAAIHGSDDRFCPGCGLAFDANADRPIATAPVVTQPQQTPANAALPSPSAPPLAPAPTPAHSPQTPVRAGAPATRPPIEPPRTLSRPTEPTPNSGQDEDEPTQILRPPAAGT